MTEEHVEAEQGWRQRMFARSRASDISDGRDVVRLSSTFCSSSAAAAPEIAPDL